MKFNFEKFHDSRFRDMMRLHRFSNSLVNKLIRDNCSFTVVQCCTISYLDDNDVQKSCRSTSHNHVHDNQYTWYILIITQIYSKVSELYNCII